MKAVFIFIAAVLVPTWAFASDPHAATVSAGMASPVYSYLGLALFILAYALVPLENKLHLRKSKPVLLAAGLIWILVALAYNHLGAPHVAHEAIRESLLEYAELFLFLLAAMTYINALEERNVFQGLRALLVSRGYSLRTIFWITGLLSFFITFAPSPSAISAVLSDELSSTTITSIVYSSLSDSLTLFISFNTIPSVSSSFLAGITTDTLLISELAIVIPSNHLDLS